MLSAEGFSDSLDCRTGDRDLLNKIKRSKRSSRETNHRRRGYTLVTSKQNLRRPQSSIKIVVSMFIERVRGRKTNIGIRPWPACQRMWPRRWLLADRDDLELEVTQILNANLPDGEDEMQVVWRLFQMFSNSLTKRTRRLANAGSLLYWAKCNRASKRLQFYWHWEWEGTLHQLVSQRRRGCVNALASAEIGSFEVHILRESQGEESNVRIVAIRLPEALEASGNAFLPMKGRVGGALHTLKISSSLKLVKVAKIKYFKFGGFLKDPTTICALPYCQHNADVQVSPDVSMIVYQEVLNLKVLEAGNDWKYPGQNGETQGMLFGWCFESWEDSN
ncbi:hypothetical protein SCHPADRAFT_891622 [Schizopora paradoxa]|uniref:Uncharacterized protein n=1 Tax=Schizopora paradoxa TaxID=27342 RepID=A0A0H2S375_9AGAM|nr:hypothetical protein SCHPADRAFT_891622 [Schizopora paradoxa]